LLLHSAAAVGHQGRALSRYRAVPRTAPPVEMIGHQSRSFLAGRRCRSQGRTSRARRVLLDGRGCRRVDRQEAEANLLARPQTKAASRPAALAIRLQPCSAVRPRARSPASSSSAARGIRHPAGLSAAKEVRNGGAGPYTADQLEHEGSRAMAAAQHGA